MRTLTIIASFLILLSLLSCGPKASLTLGKTSFAPGELIAVNFVASPSFSERAWVGIIPSDIPHGNETTNDEHDIAYIYLEKKVSGTLNFYAPGQPGKYDLRMHDTDENGKEVASVSFEVIKTTKGAELKLDKTIFKPGEEIRLAFTAPAEFTENAWIGIIPSDVPHGNETENDNHDVSYQYLNKRTNGLLVFKAPEDAGSYDFRMHDTDKNGNEITSITFTVK
ncbi:MAG TPA: hypothetical protein VF399_05985 [bacterium]